MNSNSNQQVLVICAELENYEQIRAVAAKAGIDSVNCKKIGEAEAFWRKATSAWCFARTFWRMEIFAR